MKTKMLKDSFDKFQVDWNSQKNIELFRNAVAVTKPSSKEFLSECVEQSRKLLSRWFKRHLYKSGYIAKKIEAISALHDYGWQLGMGFSVKGLRQGKINIGRYLVYLLLMIESKEGRIKSLERELDYEKKLGTDRLLEEHELILSIYNHSKTPDSIKKQIETKFGYILPYNDEDGED